MLNELYVSQSFYLRIKELVKIDVRYASMNGGIIMSFMPYGLWWRRHRRLFQEYFHRNAVAKYQPIQTQEVQAFLRRLLVTPDNFFHHIRQ
jgi:cytochrome P450